MFQKSFKGVSRMFQGCFKEASRVFQESFKEVQESLKSVSRKFQGCFKKIFKGVLREFQGCFKKVSRGLRSGAETSLNFQRSEALGAETFLHVSLSRSVSLSLPLCSSLS